MIKPSKYRAKPVAIDGIRFDSQKEARRYGELVLLQKAGEIRDLQRQVVIPLIGRDAPLKTRTGRAMRMTVDFAYADKRLGWAMVYEDSKGMATRDYEVRKAVVEAMGIKITET